MRQTISWINEHKNVGRVAVLVLLLLATIGPWTYTADGAPPAEWCRAPNILLENDRCVRLMSAARWFRSVPINTAAPIDLCEEAS